MVRHRMGELKGAEERTAEDISKSRLIEVFLLEDAQSLN